MSFTFFINNLKALKVTYKQKKKFIKINRLIETLQ